MISSCPAVTVRGRLTFERRVGFESFKLFMRYQMDFRILMTAQEEKKAAEKHMHNRKKNNDRLTRQKE